MTEVKPILLSKKDIPGGDRQLLLSECGEYLVLNQVAGKVTVIGTFPENEFMKAAEAFRS